MGIDYYQKYLKYKSKYLELCEKIGGEIPGRRKEERMKGRKGPKWANRVLFTKKDQKAEDAADAKEAAEAAEAAKAEEAKKAEEGTEGTEGEKGEEDEEGTEGEKGKEGE
jgi:hypothetical protein